MTPDTSPSCPFPYQGPPDLQQAVAAALQLVIDPELALSIVDLGLVYGVEVSAEGARVRMTMTSAACPVTDLITDEVEAELERVLPAGGRTEVELVWEPAWTPERMSERARRFMG
ncbi:MAG: hydroxylase [Leptothrix sp. (in: Bacteria)]|nr:hydroxylase [Leptothrix sp. (in: b-proteobacteria)]